MMDETNRLGFIAQIKMIEKIASRSVSPDTLKIMQERTGKQFVFDPAERVYKDEEDKYYVTIGDLFSDIVVNDDETVRHLEKIIYDDLEGTAGDIDARYAKHRDKRKELTYTDPIINKRYYGRVIFIDPKTKKKYYLNPEEAVKDLLEEERYMVDERGRKYIWKQSNNGDDIVIPQNARRRGKKPIKVIYFNKYVRHAIENEVKANLEILSFYDQDYLLYVSRSEKGRFRGPIFIDKGVYEYCQRRGISSDRIHVLDLVNMVRKIKKTETKRALKYDRFLGLDPEKVAPLVENLVEIPDYLFATYDIRGDENEFWSYRVYTLARALASHFREMSRKEDIKVVVGKDTRMSSPRILEALCEGLKMSGVKVINIAPAKSVSPTPLVGWAVDYYNADAGINVTASTLEEGKNGLKLIYAPTRRSLLLRESDLYDIKEIADHGRFVSGRGEIKLVNPLPNYIDSLKRDISHRTRKEKPFEGMKVVIDPNNGATCYSVIYLLRELGATVLPMPGSEEPKEKFSHTPIPSKPESVKPVAGYVLDNNADLGFIFDCDGDRVVIVDDKGRQVTGGHYLMLMAKIALLDIPESIVIVNNKAPNALLDYILSLGGKPEMFKTGYTNIAEKMHELIGEGKQVCFAGENTGHGMWYQDKSSNETCYTKFNLDDGCYSALRLLAWLCKERKHLKHRKLSKIINELPQFNVTETIELDIKETVPKEEIRGLKNRIHHDAKEYFTKKKYEVNDIDGARVSLPQFNGWVLIRGSMIRPYIGITIEADLNKQLRIAQMVKEFLSSKRYPIKMDALNEFIVKLQSGQVAQSFAPTSLTQPIRYQDLEGSFINNLECRLDLKKRKGKRFTRVGKNSAQLADLLNDSMDTLVELVKTDPELNIYVSKLMRKPDNRAPPIKVKVSNKLPVNSVRYFDPQTKEVEIIFNETFITQLLSAKDTHPDAVKTILAERLFHELGHDNRKGTINEERQEEFNLIRKDLTLHKLISKILQNKVNNYFKTQKPKFPSGYYFTFLDELLTLDEESQGRRINQYLNENYPHDYAIGDVKAFAKDAFDRRTPEQIIDYIRTKGIKLEAYTTPAKFIIYSGPSGVGKGTIWDRVMDRYPDVFEKILLYNSRKPRPEEIDGVHYHFRSRKEIEEMRDRGELIAIPVREDLQGIKIDEITQVYAGDKIMVLECDVNIKDAIERERPNIAEGLYSIFITPLTDEEIEKRAQEIKLDIPAYVMKSEMLKRLRIRDRELGTETPEMTILSHIDKAVTEIGRKGEYSKVIINELGEQGLERAIEEFMFSIFRRVLISIGIPEPELSGFFTSEQLIEYIRRKRIRLGDYTTPAKFIIYSGPSGVGKGTIWDRVMDRYPDVFQKVLLYNSREPRAGEEDGVHYHFRSRKEIEEMRDRDELIAIPVREDLQGIKIDEITQAYAGDKIMVLECDINIKDVIKRERPDIAKDIHSIFITPLTDEEIERRTQEIRLDIPAYAIKSEIRKRLGIRDRELGTETPEMTILSRIDKAVTEVRRKDEYSKVIVNELGEQGLERAIEEFMGYILRNLIKEIETKKGIVPSVEVMSAKENLKVVRKRLKNIDKVNQEIIEMIKGRRPDITEEDIRKVENLEMSIKFLHFVEDLTTEAHRGADTVSVDRLYEESVASLSLLIEYLVDRETGIPQKVYVWTSNPKDVDFGAHPEADCTEIMVLGRDMPGLQAKISGSVAAHQGTIVRSTGEANESIIDERIFFSVLEVKETDKEGRSIGRFADEGKAIAETIGRISYNEPPTREKTIDVIAKNIGNIRPDIPKSFVEHLLRAHTHPTLKYVPWREREARLNEHGILAWDLIETFKGLKKPKRLVFIHNSYEGIVEDPVGHIDVTELLIIVPDDETIINKEKEKIEKLNGYLTDPIWKYHIGRVGEEETEFCLIGIEVENKETKRRFEVSKLADQYIKDEDTFVCVNVRDSAGPNLIWIKPKLDPHSEDVTFGDIEEKLAHLPLYLWRALRVKLETAKGKREISEEVYDRIVNQGLGISRTNKNGKIIIETDAIPYFVEVLNENRTRGSPRVTNEDVINYLARHERAHQLIKKDPKLKKEISNLLRKLKKPALYKDLPIKDFAQLKEYFINNYGEEYRDEDKFIEELVVVYFVEKLVLNQPVRLLPDKNKPKARISLPERISKQIEKAISSELMDKLAEKDEVLAKIKGKLENIADSNATPLTREHIQKILTDIKSGVIKLEEESIDVIRVTPEGEEEVIDSIDRAIAHLLYGKNGEYSVKDDETMPENAQQLLHRAANAFIVTKDGQLILMQRFDKNDPKNQKSRTSNAFGGHVPKGKVYDEAIGKELVEELEFPERYELQGTFKLIERHGQFRAARPYNQERKSLYVYIPTDDEVKMIKQEQKTLKELLEDLGEDGFIQNRLALQEEKPGRGEIWAIHFVSLTELDKSLGRIKAGKTLRYFLKQDEVRKALSDAISVEAKELIARIPTVREDLGISLIGKSEPKAGKQRDDRGKIPGKRLLSFLFGGLGISLIMSSDLFASGGEVMRNLEQAGWAGIFESVFGIGLWGILVCAVTGIGASAIYRKWGQRPFSERSGLVDEERVRLSEALGLKTMWKALVSLFERGWSVVAPGLYRASKREQLRMSWANLFTQPELSEEEIKRIRALAEKLRRGEIARFWTKRGRYFANPENNPWLGWTYPTEEIGEELRGIEEFAESVREDYENVVVIGRGVPYAKVAAVIGERRGYPEVIVFEATHPEAVQEIGSKINLEKTLFVVSSPVPGEGYEAYEHFYKNLAEFYRLQGVSSEEIASQVGRHFVGIVEANEPFAGEAREREFLRVFTEESGVSHSIFSYEGLVPLALAGVDIGRFLESGRKGRAMCGEENVEKNLGMQLALFQERMRESGREIFMVLPEGLKGFGEAMKELIWSVWGEGERIIPIREGELSSAERYGENAAFIEVRLGGRESPAIREIKEAGYPVFEIPLRGKEEIGELFYRGEFATALSYLMRIDSFRRLGGEEGLLPGEAVGYGSEVVSPAGAIGFEMRKGEPLSEYPVRPEIISYKGTKVVVFDIKSLFDIEFIKEATPSRMGIELKVRPRSRAVFKVMEKIVKAAEETANLDGVKFAFVSSRRNVGAEVMEEMLRDYLSGYGLEAEVISRVIDSDLIIDRRRLEENGGIVGISKTPKISTKAVFNIINERLLLSGRTDGNGSEIKIITDNESRWEKDGKREMMERILWVVLEPAKEGEVLSTAAGLVVAIEGKVSQWLIDFIKARYPEEEAERLLSRIVRDGKVILPAAPVDKKYLEGIQTEERIYKVQA